ncbi:aclacinomycin oxidase [Crossiella equi]|uniref:Aclacinomycin oxidase n=1 Tax=Crossiella equi TaxID=130796 RepID=A0ABS5A4R6_9PSEU|nr:FAD-binding oxidoreductase [Crossiella equi]MBP2471573.1 aclacinomycin oxidase [Crossiella equi]
MSGLSRRGLLAGAGAAAAAAALGTGTATAREAAPGAITVRPDDRRYENLLRGNNFRFVGQPDEIRVCTSTEQVVRAVADAVRSGRRLAVRSGGHGFENLTAHREVRVLLDLGLMDEVGYDPARRAFSVRPGATLGQVYERLHHGWGVTVPGGSCPEVGAGGHFVGGGYGALSRRYGSVVDHLYAVEVVVVDRDGTARAVVATREPDDPNHDLWWAHTGGGGGNFGVVTRYWLRSTGATGTDPATLLPPSPRRMVQHALIWSWAGVTEAKLTALLRDFGTWHERNSAPGSPGTGLWGVLQAGHRDGGSLLLSVQADADLPGVDRLMDDFLAEVTRCVGLVPFLDLRRTLPWLHRMTWPGSGEPGDAVTRRYKIKGAYLRRAYTDAQLAAVYRNLIAEGGRGGSVLLIGYGGQVNAVAPAATAVAQRDMVLKAVYQTIWESDEEDDAHIEWVRALYQDVYRATGGVPAEGSYINYADADLADPELNTSGVPAHVLYHGENYPRLRRVKARWDPGNVFRHPLSVQAG